MRRILKLLNSERVRRVDSWGENILRIAHVVTFDLEYTGKYQSISEYKSKDVVFFKYV